MNSGVVRHDDSVTALEVLGTKAPAKDNIAKSSVISVIDAESCILMR